MVISIHFVVRVLQHTYFEEKTRKVVERALNEAQENTNLGWLTFFSLNLIFWIVVSQGKGDLDHRLSQTPLKLCQEMSKNTP